VEQFGEFHKNAKMFHFVKCRPLLNHANWYNFPPSTYFCENYEPLMGGGIKWTQKGERIKREQIIVQFPHSDTIWGDFVVIPCVLVRSPTLTVYQSRGF